MMRTKLRPIARRMRLASWTFQRMKVSIEAAARRVARNRPISLIMGRRDLDAAIGLAIAGHQGRESVAYQR
jgi:hypothetical protein